MKKLNWSIIVSYTFIIVSCSLAVIILSLNLKEVPKPIEPIELIVTEKGHTVEEFCIDAFPPMDNFYRAYTDDKDVIYLLYRSECGFQRYKVPVWVHRAFSDSLQAWKAANTPSNSLVIDLYPYRNLDDIADSIRFY